MSCSGRYINHHDQPAYLINQQHLPLYCHTAKSFHPSLIHSQTQLKPNPITLLPSTMPYTSDIMQLPEADSSLDQTMFHGMRSGKPYHWSDPYISKVATKCRERVGEINAVRTPIILHCIVSYHTISYGRVAVLTRSLNISAESTLSWIAWGGFL